MSIHIRFVGERKYIWFSESKTIKAYDGERQVKNSKGFNFYKDCKSEEEFRKFINSKQ